MALTTDRKLMIIRLDYAEPLLVLERRHDELSKFMRSRSLLVEGVARW